MTAINDYINYWDKWHCDWNSKIINNPDKIFNDWIVPNVNDNNGILIKFYFPEPYWGNPCSENLDAIFLNINPGKGGEKQNIKYADKDLFNPFINYKKYSQTVADLCKFSDYDTTKWMFKWRIKWLRKLLKNETIDVSNILCSDLIPWHTKSKSDIKDYAVQNETPKNIINFVINPLSNIAKSENIREEMRGKVIVRSSLLLDVLNEFVKQKNEIQIDSIEEYVVIDKGAKFSKFNSYLTIFKINNTYFFIFSGGSNSALPDVEYTVLPVANCVHKTGISLQDFITKFERIQPCPAHNKG